MEKSKDPLNDVLVEIIRKENDLYELKNLGLISSVEETVNRLSPKVTMKKHNLEYEQFISWKKNIISELYTELKYRKYISENITSHVFTRFLFRLRKRLVRNIKEKYKEVTIDKKLAAPGRTIAFKLSNMLSDEENQALSNSIDSFHTPHQLEDKCKIQSNNYYPIELDSLINRLKKDDSEFWDEIYYSFENIAFIVTYNIYLPIRYREDILQDAWKEASILFRNKVLNNDIPKYESDAHLRNFMIRIFINKCREAGREYNPNGGEISIDIIENIADTPNEEISREKVVLREIDLSNKWEVKMSLVSILLDKTSPLYKQLVKGIEEKIEILLLHSYEKKSYEEIADILVPGASPDEKRRLIVNLRQEAVRGRRILINRFMNMLPNSN